MNAQSKPAAKNGEFDLVVRNGTLVIPGIGQIEADIGMGHGKITALGSDLPGKAKDTLDASGKIVLPGIFDPHIHIGNQFSFEEESLTETRAGILGGVTTVGVFLRSLEDSYHKHMPGFIKAIDDHSYVDAVFHPQIFNLQQISELPEYAEQYGVRSFKFYMSGMPGIVNSVTDDVLLKGFRMVASIGPDTVACVHCETGALIDQAREKLARDKPDGTLADWEDAHPADAEALSIHTASYLARLAGAHLYVVHLSSRQGLEAVRNCRRMGAKFTVETTSPYLGINSHDENQFLAKMVPPIRAPGQNDALWEGIAEGSINTVGTDNTSRNLEAKQPDKGLHGSKPGIPVLGTHLPALMHFGYNSGRLPLERLVEIACKTPAEVYGIYPQKGTIAIGSDADLAIVDPALERVVDAKFLQGMSDFSPFQGKKLKGWPVATVKAGEIIALNGKIVGQANGRYLPRHPPAATQKAGPEPQRSAAQ
jgi:dihydroorotase-like cyclic amidohydrolase